MPSKARYYQVNTPKHSGKWQTKSVANKRRKKVITGLIGGYTLLAAAAGYTFLGNQNEKTAQASEIGASLNASLRIVEDKEFKVGDEVKVAITLQNTSSTQSVKNAGFSLYATNNSVKWEQASISGSYDEEALEVRNGSVTISALAPGERTEYEVSGVLQENKFPYLAILGKISYDSSGEIKTVSTNKVFTKLDNANNGYGNLLSLSSDKASYSEGQEVYVTLAYNISEENPVAPQVSGKVYIAKKGEDAVASVDCALGDFSSCSATVKNLEAGEYTALFIDETGNVFSEIYEFSVNGKQKEFAPSSQSSLELPFGSSSINGSVAVFAKRVMNLNDTPSGEKCTFVVSKDGKTVKEVQAGVESNRTCFATINTADLSGDGLYAVTLKGTSLSETIYFSEKNADTLDLQDETSVLKTGKNVTLVSEGVKSVVNQEQEIDSSGNPVVDGNGDPVMVYSNLDGVKATFGIWHPRTGEYQEVSYLNNQAFEYADGNLSVELPSKYFEKGGFYSVFVKVEEEISGSQYARYSDFASLAFDSQEVGFVSSGVLFDDINNLRIGKTLSLRLEGIVDKSGNILEQGGCTANIYQSNGSSKPVAIKGAIKDGVCNVVVPAGKVTSAGSALISFAGEGIDNNINQARQVNFVAGDADSLGGLQLEYEPARVNYANNLIVGPVTDKYGNLADAFGYKVVALDEEDNIITEIPVTITDGFAKTTLGASTFKAGILKLNLVNSKNETIIEKVVGVEEQGGKLILPTFPANFTSDDNLKVAISGLELESAGNCRLTYIKSASEYVENEVISELEQGGCAFDLAFDEARENSRALVKLEIAENVYYHLMEQKAGEPSNLFAVAAEVQNNVQDELQISLLTAPITDKHGLTVDNAKVRFEYNGRTEEVVTEDGLAKLELPLSKMEEKDVRNLMSYRFLELGIDARAGVTSISKTNDISVFLGTKDISNKQTEFSVQKASTQIYTQGSEIFKFEADTCKAYSLGEESAKSVKTHYQAGDCYVQVSGDVGKQKLIFENNGYDLGSFAYTSVEEKPEVVWCSEGACQLQVLSSIRGNVEAYLYDEGDIYKFESESLENVITIQQNGLNPMKDYLIEVRFINDKGELVSVYNQVSGELLQK